MNKALLWLGSVGVAALCVTFAARRADADSKHRCDMVGTWVETGETWLFSADYVAVDSGADSFWGHYANPAAGTTARITGAAHSGTWDIKFIYTDAAHPGWVRHLIGTGSFNRSTHGITVSGRETLKKSGVPSGNGTFAMTGKCEGT
jgi:hypothetical protein